MIDQDTKQRLPIHLTLKNGEYSRIKTSTKPLVGREDGGGAVGEKTKLAWFMMSPGIDFDRSPVLLTQTSQSDFENLCRLDVLGLADFVENKRKRSEGQRVLPSTQGCILSSQRRLRNYESFTTASEKETSDKPSLNERLHPGPPLQNQLCNVFVRARFYPILLTGDIEKGFLQVRIKEEERDSLRYFWQSPGCDEVSVYRFTRA